MKVQVTTVVVFALLVGALGYGLGYVVQERKTNCPPCRDAQEGAIVEAVDSTGESATSRAQETKQTLLPRINTTESSQLVQMQAQIEKLVSTVALQETMLDGYKETTHGHPIQWPENILPQYTEEYFQSNILRSIDESGAALEIVSFDCKEPPCMVAMRVLGDRSGMLKTETWSKNYGQGISHNANWTIKCGDGRTERVWILSPTGNGLIDPGTMSRDEFWEALMNRPRDEADKNQLRRLKARWEQFRENWVCLPPNP